VLLPNHRSERRIPRDGGWRSKHARCPCHSDTRAPSPAWGAPRWPLLVPARSGPTTPRRNGTGDGPGVIIIIIIIIIEATTTTIVVIIIITIIIIMLWATTDLGC